MDSLPHTPRFRGGEPLSASKLNRLREAVPMIDVRLFPVGMKPHCPKLPDKIKSHSFKIRRATTIPPGFELPNGVRSKWRVLEVSAGTCDGATPDGIGEPILIPEGANLYMFWLEKRGGTISFHHGEPMKNGWNLFPFQPDVNTYASAGDGYFVIGSVKIGSDENKWIAIDQNARGNLATESHEDSSGVPFGDSARKGSLEPGVSTQYKTVFVHVDDGEGYGGCDIMHPLTNAVERAGNTKPRKYYCPLHPWQLTNYPPGSSKTSTTDWRSCEMAMGMINSPSYFGEPSEMAIEDAGHMAIVKNYFTSKNDIILRGGKYPQPPPSTYATYGLGTLPENSTHYIWLECLTVNMYRGSSVMGNGVSVRHGTYEEMTGEWEWPSFPDQEGELDLFMGDRAYGRRLRAYAPDPETGTLYSTAWQSYADGNKYPNKVPVILRNLWSNGTARVLVGWIEVGSDTPGDANYRRIVFHQNLTAHLTFDAVSTGSKTNTDGHPERESVFSQPGNYTRVAGKYHYERRNKCSVKFSLDNSSATFAAQVYGESSPAEKRFLQRAGEGYSTGTIGIDYQWNYTNDTFRPARNEWQTPDRYRQDPWGFTGAWTSHSFYMETGGAWYQNSGVAWCRRDWKASYDARNPADFWIGTPSSHEPDDYDFDLMPDVQNGFVENPLDDDECYAYAEFEPIESFKWPCTHGIPTARPHLFDGGYLGAPWQSNYVADPEKYMTKPNSEVVVSNNGEQNAFVVAGALMSGPDAPHYAGVDIRAEYQTSAPFKWKPAYREQ